MNTLKIVKTSELKEIVPKENQEPLIDLASERSRILCCPKREKILVRKTVADRLKEVQSKLCRLHPAWQLVVVEGYRHPSMQEEDFLRYFCKISRDFPSLELDEVTERVHQWVALPSVAGHPTGGAVDVTLADNGKELKMGSPIADFSCPDVLPTFAAGLKKEHMQRRRLLHDLMIEEGFAPFYGEWWHYSYGDREWAAFYSKKETEYSPLYL